MSIGTKEYQKRVRLSGGQSSRIEGPHEFVSANNYIGAVFSCIPLLKARKAIVVPVRSTVNGAGMTVSNQRLPCLPRSHSFASFVSPALMIMHVQSDSI